MPNLVLVPVHLDALFLSHDQLVAGPKADFTRLPYLRNGQDHQSDAPFLSEEILTKPFHNENLHLKAGIHLHWALPDALTKTLDGKDSSHFPTVPNRWLISRIRNGQKEKTWVVESDYLYSDGMGQYSGSISYPYPKISPNDQPFRFLGRKMPWAAWKNATANNNEYLDHLTAVGYGEPTFAAFYPNCHSVFGFHDGEINPYTLANTSYEVTGWYNNPEEDYLKQLQQSLLTLPNAPTTLFDMHELMEQSSAWRLDIQIDKQAFLTANPTATTLLDDWIANNWIALIDEHTIAIMPKAQWKKEPDERALSFMSRLLGPYFDLQTLCFSHLKFPETIPEQIEHPGFNNHDFQVTIANTGSEALSAYLSHQLAGEFTHEQVEDQLEAILLASKLENHRLDTGAKFEEARHEKGFNAIPGGTRWVIRPQNDPHSAAKADNVAEQQQITLPEALGHALNQLNLLQGRYDQAQKEIQSLKHHLFSDWYKYLKCVYPPDGTHEEFIPPDEVKYFIEQNDLSPLSEKSASTGKLNWQEDEEKRVSEATVVEGVSTSLAQQVATAINQLIEQLKTFNREGGLLLALKLGEQSEDGSVPDFSGRENSGQLSGEVNFVDDITFLRVAEFNGTNAQLNLPLLQAIKSISFWTFIPAESTSGCLLDAGGGLNAFLSNGDTGTAWKKLFVNGQQVPAINWNAIPKGDWVHLHLSLAQPIEASFTLMSRSNGQDFLAGNLAHIHVYDFELEEQAIQRDMRHYVRQQYVLQASAASRYWQAKEPVALFTGEAIKPSPRHGFDGNHRMDGKLHCISWPQTDINSLINEAFGPLSAKLDALKAQYPDDHFAFETWGHQPWHPFMLEWQVIMSPLSNKSNLNDSLRTYHRDFVTENYEMKENAVDLNVKPGKFSITNVAYEYSGSSVLTPYADLQLKDRLEAYLKKQVVTPWYIQQEIEVENRNYDFTSQEVKNILNNYIQVNEATITEDPVNNLLRAYNYLQASNHQSLSQTLGGFNDALLMHRLVMQTPIDDPIGFPNYRYFADYVGNALGKDIHSAPDPNADFNPIRSGVMRVNQLQLMDTFGRSKALYSGDLFKPHQMEVPGRADMVHLRPRLVQPARLNFRWLSASDGDQEMNEHPATSPICGWILVNNLDHSLMIYQTDGAALCSVSPDEDTNFLLRHPPGPKFGQAFDLQEADNMYLRQMLDYLRGRQQNNPQFLQHFITVIDSSLANIDPANFAQHTDIAMLMSRPLALVRASMDLELAGLPAINHDWNVFRHDLLRNTRQSEAFTDVEFPIRLGEYKQLNDGLVGYWLEEGDGYKDLQFFAPQSDIVDDPNIITRSTSRFTLCQAVSDTPKMLSLLLDPRGLVHATSGILPTKAIRIPPDQYAKALQRIEITFLTAPLLSDSQQVQIALPAETDYQWSWLANTNGGWDEISVPGVVRKSAFVETFAQEADAIWDLLGQDSIQWIIPLDDARATVVEIDQRAATQLGEQWEPKRTQIDDVLAQVSLGQASLQADLHGTNLIREGWLKLKKISE
ncbi:MAG: hypothetical protein DHS20C18_29610 [Saprospiraceae bacterium]|nr:MAG: hypothetical protein DHS20C18_29610 [Saprospiraceae bacterium]